MSTSLESPRQPWFVRFSWIPAILSPVWLTVIVSLLVGEVLDVLSPSASSRKLHVVCDRVVERLLTTRDPVELERSRILVNTLGCSVSDRMRNWPSNRAGGLWP